MKRWWWVAAAIVLFFLGDRLGAEVLGRLLDHSPQRFCKMYAGELEGEIVLLGNSRGVVDMHAPSIAQATGKRTVNISHNGMSGQLALALLQDYLERYPKPELLVVEASFFNSKTTEAGVVEYMPFWNHSHRLMDLGRKYSHDEVVAAQIANLYQFNSELFLRSLIYLVSGGSDQGVVMNATLSTALVEQTKALTPMELAVYSPEVEALVEIVKLAREAGIEVRLVLAPYLPDYADKITNFDAIVAEISDSTGEKVFDFSRSLADTKLFADRVHMNSSGSRELTRLMKEAGVLNVDTEKSESP